MDYDQALRAPDFCAVLLNEWILRHSCQRFLGSHQWIEPFGIQVVEQHTVAIVREDRGGRLGNRVTETFLTRMPQDERNVHWERAVEVLRN
jgi:hypothetical protein